MPLTLAEARDRVKANCQASVDPTLTDNEVDDLLTQTMRGALWTGTTAYTVGARVLPTVRNGHTYRVTTGGTSASSEPTWPTGPYSRVTSGTVTYEEAGPDTGEIYDVRRATWAAYRLKLAKVTATAVNLSTPGGAISLNQMTTNLERAMARWTPVEIG